MADCSPKIISYQSLLYISDTEAGAVEDEQRIHRFQCNRARIGSSTHQPSSVFIYVVRHLSNVEELRVGPTTGSDGAKSWKMGRPEAM